jgi:hypothetical protein
MSVLARTVSTTSKPNSPSLLRLTKRHTILSGRNTLVESVLISESVESVFGKETFKSSHKLDRVDMDRFSLRRRRILEKFVR